MTEKPSKPSKNSIFGIPLPILMVIGLCIGSAIGYWQPNIGKELLPLGQVFVKALRMLVIPLVFSSIVLGIYQMGQDIKVFGSIVLIAIIWFLTATGLCATIGIVMNELFHPGVGVDLSIPGGKVPANAGMTMDWVQFLTDLVPGNIVSAMAEPKILQVLFFGIMLGAALSNIGEAGQPVVAVLKGIQAATMKMVRWLIALAPIAITAVMAWLLATQGSTTLLALAKLVGAVYAGLLVAVVLMCLVLLAIGQNPFSTIKKISEPLLLAFTTRSSEVTMPIHMEILERAGIPNKVVSTIIPLGYSFNQDGSSVYVSLAVAFIAEAHNIHLDLHTMIKIIFATVITTKGMGNVGGGGLVSATTIIVAMGLPVEAIAIVAGIDVFLDMGRTTINVLGNTVATLLVCKFGKLENSAALADATSTEPSPHPSRGETGMA